MPQHNTVTWSQSGCFVPQHNTMAWSQGGCSMPQQNAVAWSQGGCSVPQRTMQWRGPKAGVPCHNTQCSGVVPRRVFHATTHNAVAWSQGGCSKPQHNTMAWAKAGVPCHNTQCSGVVPRRVFHAATHNTMAWSQGGCSKPQHNTMAWSQGGCSMPQHTIQWRGPKAAAPCHSSGNGFILSWCRFPRLFSSTTSLVVLSGAVRISHLLYKRCNVLFMHGTPPFPPPPPLPPPPPPVDVAQAFGFRCFHNKTGIFL